MPIWLFFFGCELNISESYTIVTAPDTLRLNVKIRRYPIRTPSWRELERAAAKAAAISQQKEERNALAELDNSSRRLVRHEEVGSAEPKAKERVQ